MHPRAVAVVGASANPNGRGGANFIDCYRHLGFSGRIYPINPRAKEVKGLPAYPSVLAVPEPLDFVIVAVPAVRVADVLRDCIAKGVPTVHVFTAGFNETGEPEGRQLADEVRQIIANDDLLLIGPNCMGFYVPESGIGTWDGASKESGPVAFISQSGALASRLTVTMGHFNVRFSKVVSYGNGYNAEAPDFLEYLAEDPATGIIAMYLEGIRDGQRLLRSVRDLNRTKPVLLWKGGLTESGTRAVNSHTASLAGDEAIWNAFYRQTGATRADSLDELMDLMQAFLFLKPPRSRRIAVIGGGGGTSVAVADACSRAGLTLPPLTMETQLELHREVPLAGMSVRNPLDAGLLVSRDPETIEWGLKTVAEDPSVDAILLHYFNLSGWGNASDPRSGRRVAERLIHMVKEKMLTVPVAVVIRLPDADSKQQQLRAEFIHEYTAAGIPVFASEQRAARALAALCAYREYYEKGN